MMTLLLILSRLQRKWTGPGKQRSASFQFLLSLRCLLAQIIERILVMQPSPDSNINLNWITLLIIEDVIRR